MSVQGPGFKPFRPAQPTQAEMQQKLKDVGALYEKQFLREMVKAMRSTVPEGAVAKSMGEKIFQEQLDQEYVEAWGEKGGIGLGQLIYEQLMERFGAQMGLGPVVERPQGPLKMDHRSVYRPTLSQQSVSPDKLAFVIPTPAVSMDKESKLQSEENSVSSPWAGTVTEQYRLGEEQDVIEITHQNGLKSQLVYKGQSTKAKNQEVHAGEAIGVLSPGTRSLSWSVERLEKPGETETVSE